MSRAKTKRARPRKAPPVSRDLGTEVIVFYKSIKAAIELGAATLLGIFIVYGPVRGVDELTHGLHQHVTNAGMLELSRIILGLATPHHIKLTALALFLDGLLSVGEAYALRRRWWWAPWLVVGASSTLIPFEVFELIRKATAGRVALLGINLLVVLYLVRQNAREKAAAELRVVPPPEP